MLKSPSPNSRAFKTALILSTANSLFWVVSALASIFFSFGYSNSFVSNNGFGTYVYLLALAMIISVSLLLGWLQLSVIPLAVRGRKVAIVQPLIVLFVMLLAGLTYLANSNPDLSFLVVVGLPLLLPLWYLGLNIWLAVPVGGFILLSHLAVVILLRISSQEKHHETWLPFQNFIARFLAPVFKLGFWLGIGACLAAIPLIIIVLFSIFVLGIFLLGAFWWWSRYTRRILRRLLPEAFPDPTQGMYSVYRTPRKKNYD
jgi:hypothetical protein